MEINDKQYRIFIRDRSLCKIEIGVAFGTGLASADPSPDRPALYTRTQIPYTELYPLRMKNYLMSQFERRAVYTFLRQFDKGSYELSDRMTLRSESFEGKYVMFSKRMMNVDCSSIESRQLLGKMFDALPKRSNIYIIRGIHDIPDDFKRRIVHRNWQVTTTIGTIYTVASIEDCPEALEFRMYCA